MPSTDERTRSFLVVTTLDHLDGRPVLELADPQDPRDRWTLWPGLPPASMPFHPSLATVLLTGRLNGEPVWIESRGLGVRLDQLARDLDGDLLNLLLQDLCDVLDTLHQEGLAHGDLRPSTVLVGPDGWVLLAGAGLKKGHPEQDLAGLISLARDLSGHDAKGIVALPEVAPPSPGALLDLLEAQLGHGPHDDLRRRLAALARQRQPLLVPQALGTVRVLLEEAPTSGVLDEVGMNLGPEEGSEDSWSASHSNADITREASLGDTTEGAGVSLDLSASRVQILARLLAPPSRPIPPDRFRRAEGQPNEAVRALVRSEPLDPLPFPMVTPSARPPVLVEEPMGGTVIGKAAPAPARRGLLLWVGLPLAVLGGLGVGFYLLYLLLLQK